MSGAGRAGRRRPRLAVTLGDPRGIGPEVTARALATAELRELSDYLLVGPPGLVEGFETLSVGDWRPGADTERAGWLAGEAVRLGVELALAGEVDGLVTAPIEKSAFRAAGWPYPGHTEMLQALTGAPAVGMMMVAESTRLGGGLRVVLATTHLPLRDVPGALTAELLVEQARLAERALRAWWEIPAPRVALCAFNPHASDGGLFGDEEARVYAPALGVLRNQGVQIFGPVPADTVFGRALRGEFDVVIAPYHDVGMAAFKTAAFGGGVNVTLGLPFPRTSPDHGTALDIAGRGVADPSSMAEAVRLAASLATRFTASGTRA
jgi:4-hydroxythreonine-4-phosphate dehydrogenase